MDIVIKFNDKKIGVKDVIQVKPEEIEELLTKIIDELVTEYTKGDYEIHDLLNSICINDLSISDVTTIYARLYHIIESDTILRKYCEGGYVNVATNTIYPR